MGEAKPGDRHRLAGDAAGDDVDGRSNSASPPFDGGADIVVPFHVRPVLRKHLAAERVNLYLADDRHASALQTEVETADTGEQRQDVHIVTART